MLQSFSPARMRRSFEMARNIGQSRDAALGKWEEVPQEYNAIG